MEQIIDLGEVNSLKENKVLFGENKKTTLVNSKIVFKGKNNILFLEDDVNIKDSTLSFEGDNSVIYLSSNHNIYLLNVIAHSDSVFYMGEKNYMNGKLNAICSERKHIVIGNRGLFSFGIWLRMADPHIIYDIESRQRKNITKSIFLGDHIWVGQSAMILKGTKMGSGSILGAMSLISNKTIPSNTIWGGNPAKQITSGIFFTNDVVHRYTPEQTEKSMINEDDIFIYNKDDSTLSFDEIDKALTDAKDANERLDYILKNLRGYKEKNRFFVGEMKSKKKRFGK